MTRRHLITALAGAAAAIATAPADARDRSYDGTVAERTWVDLEADARSGASVLWAIGSIEEHGPHLPLATDAYVANAQVRLIRQALSKRGLRTVALPPYLWGVNSVTGAFPGSLRVRPEAMTMVIEDVLDSLRTAGFRRAFLITGHYDAEHNRAIARAVAEANAKGGIEVVFVLPAQLARRLWFGDDDRGIARTEMPSAPKRAGADLHAGDGETSMMLALDRSLVRIEDARRAKPTDLSEGDVDRWRTGGDTARRLTPRGYLGAPANASTAKGRGRLLDEVEAYTAAILRALPGAAPAPPPTRK